MNNLIWISKSGEFHAIDAVGCTFVFLCLVGYVLFFRKIFKS